MPYLEVRFNLPLAEGYTYFSPEEVPVGCRVKVSLGRRAVTGWVVSHPEAAPSGVKIREIEKVIDSQPLFDTDLLELAKWMSRLTFCSLGEALAAMLPGGKQERHPLDETDGDDSLEKRNLSESQQAVLDEMARNRQGWFYLYGPTGSGKTEVFLREIEHSLSLGRGVIYLVPEIALSHHLVEGLRRRFPGKVAVLHSGLTPSRRLAEWRRIQSGEAQLVIGARSAVFAPLKDIGLIVIDEEHEGSYKSSATPRYHARQAAMRRCRTHRAQLLMGSATPSVEAWHLMEQGGLKRLNLQGRPAGGAEPQVTVVDMKKEKSLLSRRLVEDMSRVLGEGRQVLLFLNRRGFSYRYACRSCGAEVLCRHCSVPLTYHKSRGSMICHYCGSTGQAPSVCPECRSVEMQATGYGTEKVEEDVARLFPEKTAVRLDADAARKKGMLEQTLRQFREGTIDILLGTQMVAKGLNAPKLKLAGVLSADGILNLPDFRAAERTFSLVVQTSGRVGRFLPDGEVVIQVFNPDTPAIRYASAADVEGFYASELEARRLLGFPPFSRLFRVLIRGSSESRVISASQNIASLLAGTRAFEEILGPAECVLSRISGQYRRHIILRTQSFDASHAALRAVFSTYTAPHGIRLDIDPDPVNLL